MPKKLNVEPNQRVDIPDYLRGANDYTQESLTQLREKLVQARRALIMEGFRVEIQDQTTNPGQITVHNGNALDRDGNHLNNEDQVNDSRTLVLSGASTSFYLEIEFVENKSDIDSRAFWDPTFVNTGTVPPGREFNLNVSTRLSPDWRIVSPVSTSGFESTANPASTRIPLAVLTTDGSNEITVGSNPGLVQVVASTTTEEDLAGGETEIRLHDTRLFPDAGAITLDVGGLSEATNITANDRANGVLTISPAVVGSMDAGAIVRISGGTPTFVSERTTPVGASGHPDFTRRMWQGDEIRGSGLVKSKETFGNRDDLSIKQLKDYVDYMAAQFRELKFGGPRDTAVEGHLPPSPATAAFLDTKRWFDEAGSIAGARSFTVTIGRDAADASWGDLNSSTTSLSDLLQQAHDAFNAANFSGISILVKRGSYTWDSTVTINRPVYLEFEQGTTFSSITVDDLIDVTNPFPLEIKGLKATAGLLRKRILVSTITGAQLKLEDCELGEIDFSAITNANFTLLQMDRCSMFPANNQSIITTPFLVDIFVDGSHVRDCYFAGLATGTNWTGAMREIVFDNTVFDSAKFCNVATANVVDVLFSKCVINGTGATPLDFTCANIENLCFSNCKFVGDSAGVNDNERTFMLFNTSNVSNNIIIKDCDFSEVTTPGTDAATLGFVIRVVSELQNFVVMKSQFGVTTGTALNHDVIIDLANTSGGSHWIIENSIKDFYRGVRTASSATSHVHLVNNAFLNEDFGVASRSDTALEVGYGRSVLIGNYIRMSYTNFANPLVVKGIELVGNAASTHTVVANNYIANVGSTGLGTPDGDAYGIFYSGTLACRANISGNTITGVRTGGGVLERGDMYGVYLYSTAGHIEGTVTGNVITMDGGGSTPTKSCIWVRSDLTSPGSCLISGNRLELVSNGDNDWAVLRISASGVNVVGNYISSGSILAANPAKATTAIYLDACNQVKLLGNYVDCFTNDNTHTCVYATHPIAGIMTDVEIIGNTFQGGVNQDNYMILVTSSLGAEMVNFRYNDNLMICRAQDILAQPILFDFLEGTKNVQVDGNQIYETVFHAPRQLVYIASRTGGDKVEGLQFTNNQIFGAPDQAISGDRTGSPCVEIVRCEYVNVTGNSIINWAHGANDGTVLELESCGFFVLNGNVLEPGDGGLGAGNETLRIINCQSGIYASNILGGLGRAGSDDATGTVGLSAGTNKLTST